MQTQSVIKNGREIVGRENDRNPQYIIAYTAAGKVTRKNPQYDPRKCIRCGKALSVFGHKCEVTK